MMPFIYDWSQLLISIPQKVSLFLFSLLLDKQRVKDTFLIFIKNRLMGDYNRLELLRPITHHAFVFSCFLETKVKRQLHERRVISFITQRTIGMDLSCGEVRPWKLRFTFKDVYERKTQRSRPLWPLV